MNNECIYFCNKATEEDYKDLAERIKKKNIELYPVCISVINGDTEVTRDYDNLGRKKTIPDKGLVLFVQGKYHCMQLIRVAEKNFYPWFPVKKETFSFTDLYNI